MNLDQAKSYIVGYFLGDGSRSLTYNKRDRFTLFATPEDKPRLERATREIGLVLNWGLVVKGKTVERATIPVVFAMSELWLDRIEGRTSYDKRVPNWPWLDKARLIEGFWDADGIVSFGTQTHNSGKPKHQTVGFTLVNQGLSEDLKLILEGYGFHPYLRCKVISRGDFQCVLRIHRTEFTLFHGLFTLQAKKQMKMDQMVTWRA